MKYRTTKKEVRNGYQSIICIGYCDLQNLLTYENVTAYTVRREGWAADIYDFGSTAIVTGYAPFGNIHPEYDLQQKYDKAAKKIKYNYTLRQDEKKERVNQLLKDYIKEVIANDKI